MDLKIIDKIIDEPPGGAHNDPEGIAATVKSEILAVLTELEQLSVDDLLRQRLEKFRKLGVYQE